MGGSAPQPTNPAQTSAGQFESNLGTLESAQAATNVNQITPTGSLTYYQTGVGPNGVPTYTAVQQQTPAQQQLLKLQEQGMATAGGAANNMLGSSFDQYSSAPDLNNMAGGTADSLARMKQSYLQPQFDAQISQLDTQLRNQGIMPGTPAYQQQMLQTQQNQGNVMQNFAAQMQPQAFAQAMSQYSLPLATATQLSSFLNPQGPALTQTPQASMAPTNVTGAVAASDQAAQQAYATQVAQQDAIITGLMGMAGGLMKM